jgi:hypothetical protein
VQEHDRLALRVAAFLPVNFMAVADGEVSLPMRLYWRVMFATQVHARTS